MTVPDGARPEIVAWLEEIAERDPLARLLADDDGRLDPEKRDELLSHVEAGNLARHRQSARELSALAAGLLADAGLDEVLTEQMEGFSPGADSDHLVAARERVWWTAVAVADSDAEIARHLRETYDGILDLFAGPLRDMLAASRLRPRGGMSQSELNVILGLITDGMTLRGRIDPASTPESRAIVEARVFELLTEEDPDRPPVTVEPDEAAAIDRRLALSPSLSDSAMADHVALLRLAQTDDEALLRARLRCTVLLNSPKARSSRTGRAAWRLAALTLGSLDPASTLAVQDAAAASDSGLDPLDELALIRALLRLERPEAAALKAADLAAGADLTPDLRAQATIVEAAARLELDEAARALELAHGVYDSDSASAVHAAAIAASAAMALGQDDLAGEFLAGGRSTADASRPGYRALVALDLAEGEYALRNGLPGRASDAARAAGERLHRHGDQHAPGGPWRLVLARALLQKDDKRRDALQVLEQHEAALGPRPLPGAQAALLAARADAANEPGPRRMLRERALALAEQSGLARLARTLREDLAQSIEARADNGSTQAGPAGLDEFNLTPRVRQVVALVSAGLRDAEIASELGISPRTVNNHVATALRVTGARNRVELAKALATPS